MKRTLVLLTLLMTTTVSSAHPLDGAIRELVKTELELDDINNGNAGDTDLTTEINRLKLAVGSVWVDTVLAPMRISDAKLNKLGYYLAEINPINHYFEVRKNQNSQQLDQEARDLKQDRWVELGKAADEQLTTIGQVGGMLANPDYTGGISNSQKESVASGATGRRLEALQSIKKRATTTIACVGYFSIAPLTYGLVPVMGTSGTLIWSAADLLRVHGARDINSLSADQRVSVKSELQEIMDKVGRYSSVCISLDQAAFFEDELNKMGRN